MVDCYILCAVYGATPIGLHYEFYAVIIVNRHTVNKIGLLSLISY